MKLNILLFLSIQTILTSCNGQNSSHTADKRTTLTVGDTVKELGSNLMVVYQDKKNNFWFGSWVEGLYRYDGKTILHFTSKNGLPDNRIEDIKEDKSGNIYINTGKGISKFDGQSFTTLTVANADNEWKLEPNDLWFKSAQFLGVIYRYDGNLLYKLQLPKTKLDEAYNSSAYGVYSIYKDSKGNVWFGTAVLGVCRYNGKSVDWISEEDVTELHNGPSNGVRSIIEDKDGYFWFNTMHRYKVNANNTGKQTFYTREKSIGSLDGKKDSNLNEYLSIAKDNNNELWIATYSDGIWHYNGKNIVHYPVKDGTTDITVFSIYKDNNGDLWLGTHETGVYKFNGQTFERFKP